MLRVTLACHATIDLFRRNTVPRPDKDLCLSSDRNIVAFEPLVNSDVEYCVSFKYGTPSRIGLGTGTTFRRNTFNVFEKPTLYLLDILSAEF